MQSNDGILYFEPSNPPSSEPLVDELTMLMAGALRGADCGTGVGDNFFLGGGYRGFHTCSCGVTSSNTEHRLANGQFTNSLATHYLAWHRPEIEETQLEKVRALADIAEPVRPTEKELGTPQR